MDKLLDTANRMIDKTGLVAEPNGDAVDIKIYDVPMGTLSLSEIGQLMYTSADGDTASGDEITVKHAILDDLNNQFEFTEVEPGSFQEAVATSIQNKTLRRAVLEAYNLYKKKSLV
jgi:hypothetical protein